MLLGTNVTAQTTVGSETNDTEWWSAFSKYFTVAPNKTVSIAFDNYSDKAENWHNFIVAVTNDKDRGADGYSELAVLRADNFAWQYSKATGGDNYDVTWFSSLTNNYNWDTFKDDLDGAHVVVSVARAQKKVTVHATITTSGEAEYYLDFKTYCSNPEETLRFFLTTEKGHLKINDDSETTTDTPGATTTSYVVGATDFSSEYLGDFSEKMELTEGKRAVFEFTNHSSKKENFHNFVAWLGTNKNDVKVALRADNWENAQWDNKGIESNFNWDTFKDDLDGANVVTTFTYADGSVIVRSDITTKGGAKYYEQFTKTSLTGTLYAAMGIQSAYLEVTKAVVEPNPVSVDITDGGWATLYTEQALDFSAVDGLTAYTATCDGSKVTLTQVNDVPANTGVVLKGAKGTYAIPVAASSTTAKGDLNGNAAAETTYNAIEGYNLYVLTKNGEKAQFTRVTSGTIAAGKAYLTVSETAAPSLDVTFGETTDIRTVAARQTQEGIFNLSGQRVAKAQKGLYIVNGKKVVVK